MIIALLLVLPWTCMNLYPPILTKPIHYQITQEMNNTHYFIIREELLTSEMETNFQQYSERSDIQFYLCENDLCDDQHLLYLLINSIQIDFNGNNLSPDDMKKWISYRIDEHPNRMHSLQELQEYARERLEVFCFVDIEKEKPEIKEYLFAALAKKMHYLHFCLVDQSIVKTLGLHPGHLALIRQNLTVNVDKRSQMMDASNPTELIHVWLSYLLRIFMSDMRLENGDPRSDSVIVQCDLSLECEDDMILLVETQQKWRDRHPQLSFGIRLHPTITGIAHYHDEPYNLPLYKYVEKEAKEAYQEVQGATVKVVDILKREYLYPNSQIRVQSVDELIQKYKAGDLKEVNTEVQRIVEPSKPFNNLNPAKEDL